MMTATLLDPSAGTADLTWVSQPDRSYVIKFSTDLAEWQVVGDEIPSQGNETRAVRSVSPVPERAFFRVEEVQVP